LKNAIFDQFSKYKTVELLENIDLPNSLSFRIFRSDQAVAM
jgi:hypothetical protein